MFWFQGFVAAIWRQDFAAIIESNIVRTTCSGAEVSAPTCSAAEPSPGEESVFAGQTPSLDDESDGSAYSLGFRFSSAAPGLLTSVRFFKAASEAVGGHSVSVYDADSGALLATASSGSEYCRGPGWTNIRLKSPLAVQPGVNYIAAVDRLLYYAKTADYFTQPLQTSTLRVPAGANVAGAAGAMPTENWGPDSNYWVDGEAVSKHRHKADC